MKINVKFNEKGKIMNPVGKMLNGMAFYMDEITGKPFVTLQQFKTTAHLELFLEKCRVVEEKLEKFQIEEKEDESGPRQGKAIRSTDVDGTYQKLQDLGFTTKVFSEQKQKNGYEENLSDRPF